MAQSIKNIGSLSRLHIVFLAAGGSLVFGWLLTGSFHPLLALIVAVDWFLVNIVNRVLDRTEDLENKIPSTEFAFLNSRKIYIGVLLIYIASFSIHFFWQPDLLPIRVAGHLLGLFYNFRLLRGRDGKRWRIKELYFFKNGASCTGFLITLFAYPIAILPLRDEIGPTYILVLMIYFALLEVSFEVIYDLRDIKGDRAAHVASYPVVHGPAWSEKLVILLNLFSATVLLAGAAFGLFGLKELILIAAPLIQMSLFIRGLRRGFGSADCIWITWTFAIMNYIYCLWVIAGLPLSFPWPVTLPLIIEISLVIIGLLAFGWLKNLYGLSRFLVLYGVLAFGGWLAEQTAIALYDFYWYSQSWHAFVGHVPVAIALIWPLVILTTHHVIRRMGFLGWRAVGAGTVMVILDACLIEIVCANAGLWQWAGQGLFGVPVIGFLGWGCFAVGALFSVEFLKGGGILLAPVVGLATTHSILQILWRGGMKYVSYSPLPLTAVFIVMATISLALTFLALKYRKRLSISLLEILPRLMAALLMYYILFVSHPPVSLVIFSLIFAPPYLGLAVYIWTMPGGREPITIQCSPHVFGKRR